MTYILSIETATPVCSVALHDQGKLIALQELHLDKSHATYLTQMISEVLKHGQVESHQLAAVAVSEGPGSYTGLRIGGSTAKGIAYALQKPLIAVSTLEAMTKSVSQTQTEPIALCPMLDARRMEVYCQLYSKEGHKVMDTTAIVVESYEPFQNTLTEGPTLFFGSGAPKCMEVLGVHDHARLVEGGNPSAKSIGELAWEQYHKQQFVDIAYWEPFYLKEFQAGKPKPRKRG